MRRKRTWPLGSFEKHKRCNLQICLPTLKNNTLLDQLKLLCVRDDLTMLEDLLNKTDSIEFCSREILTTNWTSSQLTILTAFVALLKCVSMFCRDAVLSERFLRNSTFNCLRYEENTGQTYKINLCLFRALALLLHSNHQLEKENSKMFNLFISRFEGCKPNQFKDVQRNC